MYQKEITSYYNQLAKQYDDDRFGNSYGAFIDLQEKAIVKDLVQHIAPNKVLDLACGTGRFLEFANFGLDASTEMIKVARQKYPFKNLVVATAEASPFEDQQFQSILSFHLLMHLDKPNTKAIFDEAHRLLKKGGQFIFDVPSEKRRNAISYKAKNWHAANAFSLAQIRSLCGKQWKLVAYHGILFLPIHRIPITIRPLLTSLDNRLCRSWMKEYSSYLVFVLEKI